MDYAISYVRADGSVRPKVFKLKNLTLDPGETVQLEKRHAVKRITTRRYYPGRHTVDVRINGKSLGKKGFELVMAGR